MSTATLSSSTAKRQFTPEQIECAIRGVVRRSVTDEDEACLVTKRMRRVLNGEATVDELSRGGSVIPKNTLEAYVQAARIALEHIVDGIAEAVAAFAMAAVGEKSNDHCATPDVQSSTAENGHNSLRTPQSINTTEEPRASKPSETPAVQPASQSGSVKKAARLWGPLSKRKPTSAAEVLDPSPLPETATEDQSDTDEAYLKAFAAPDCFVDIDAEMQAQMEEILANGRKTKEIPVLPSEQDCESDEDTIAVVITHELAEKIANSIDSPIVQGFEAEEAEADDQERSSATEVTPENILAPTEEPIDVGNTDDLYKDLAFDLEMAKMDNSSMEFDLHLSDASDPVEDAGVENIPIIGNNNDGELFPDGLLSGGKDNASGQNYDNIFVDIENIDGDGA